MRIINLHISLFKFLRQEARKPCSVKGVLQLAKKLLPAYGQALLTEYKRLFQYLDPEFMKQQAQFNKVKKLKEDLNRALRMLRYIDNNMIKHGVSRTGRRQFWRDFYRDGQVRNDVFDALVKEIK